MEVLDGSVHERPALAFSFHRLCPAGGGKEERRLGSSTPLPASVWVLAVFIDSNKEHFCEPLLETRCALKRLNLEADLIYGLE